MSDWRPVSEIGELASQLFAPPPLPLRFTQMKPSEEGEPATPPSVPIAEPFAASDLIGYPLLVTPWRRYLAKMLDISAAIIPAVAVQIAFSRYSPEFAIWLSDPSTSMVLVVVGVVSTPFVEAFYSTAFGNTPGKALLGISVATIAGRKLSYVEYLIRNFRVAWAGLGAFFPVFAFIMMIYQFRMLLKLGSTTYDLNRYIVRALPIARMRVVAAILALVAIIVGNAALNVLATHTDEKFYQGQQWTNPHTLAKADVPAGWVLANETNNLGHTIYVFTRPREELQVILGYEVVAPSMTLGDYVQAFARAVSKDMTLSLPGEQTAVGVRGAWTLNGQLTADATQKVTVTFLAQNNTVWRSVGVRFKGANPNTEAYRLLRDRLLSTVMANK